MKNAYLVKFAPESILMDESESSVFEYSFL